MIYPSSKNSDGRGGTIKILLIGNAYPTQQQVCVVWLRRIAEGLEASGCRVDRLVIRGMARWRLGRLWQYLLFYLRLLLARFDGYDIVYLHHPSHTALPVLLRRIRGAKLVVNLHGLDLLPDTRIRFLGRMFRCITLWACRRADLVVVPSDYYRRELCRVMRPRRVHVSPSGGVDMARLRPATQAGNGSLRIGYLGHLASIKAVDVLLKAAAQLTEVPEIVLVGDGPQRADLESLAGRLGIGKRVRFVGAVPYNRIADHLQAFSVLVFPTRQESLGLVAVEAMACGVPVIASRIPALVEYIREGVNGLLFEPGNVNELAVAIERFGRLSKQQRRTLSQGAVQTAGKYDSARVTTELAAAFRRLVGQDTPLADSRSPQPQRQRLTDVQV
ncbi:MAG: glycosyltransferase family 4 protein [Pirellulales bacterium]|nr:glycosyltransferase family 4 protein [Pirellulales bacterium]